MTDNLHKLRPNIRIMEAELLIEILILGIEAFSFPESGYFRIWNWTKLFKELNQLKYT